MRTVFGVFAILILMSAGVASACPPPAAASAPTFAALPPWSPVYYCAASAAPQTVGDLSYAGWARHVQVCTRMCSYAAVNPSDPNSPLMEVGCGPGFHPATYYVEPPRPSTARSAVTLKNPSCDESPPSRAAATPGPAHA